MELERDVGFLAERLSSHARLESDEQKLWSIIKRFEENIGLVRRDQQLTQAVRDFAHQCKLILFDKGMFDRPNERIAELQQLRNYFDAFVKELDRFTSGSTPTAEYPINAARTATETSPFFSLVSGSISDGILDFHVRNDGQPITVLDLQTITPGCHVRQWHPTSLPPTAVLRATIGLDRAEQSKCVLHLSVRDRTGRQRAYELRLDTQSSPQRFDFVELSEQRAG